MPSIWRKTGGSWVKLKTVYRKTGGSWQSVKRVWRKSEGTWRLVFLQSITPSIAQQVTVTMTTGTTQLKTLVGRLYRWSDATSVSYQFTKSTNGISFSNISGASGTSTNPASGLSNTLDQYTLVQADVAANTYKLGTSSTWNSSSFISPGTTTTNFTISSLSNSTSYDFRVRGWTGTSNNYGYYGNWNSITKSTTGLQAPNAPTGLYGDLVGTDSFFLGWTASVTDSTHDAPTSYDYGVSTSNTTAPATLLTGTTGSDAHPSNNQYKNVLIENTDLYQLIDELTPNTDYYAWVRGKNSAGNSSWAVSAKITTDPLKPPNNITGLTHDSASAGKNSLKFTFTAPAEDTTHDLALTYRYSYNTTNVAPTGTGDYETLDNTASITIGGSLLPLTANTTYYIFIKAKNNDGLSSSWVSASGKTLADLNPPTQATGLTVTNRSPSGFDFSWTANGGTATSFKVAYNTTGVTPTLDGFEEGKWYDPLSASTSYRFQALNANTTYYAYVKGYNDDGTATATKSGTITTLAAPVVSNPTWSSNATTGNFQRSNYSQLTTQKSRTTSVITVYKNDAGDTTTNPGNLATQYSTTNNTSVTLANLATPYDGTRTVSGAFSNRITANVTSSTSQALTNDIDGTITDTPTGGSPIKTGQYDYDFTLDSPTVNGTSYYHVFLSGRDGIDNNAAPKYMRIRAYVTDYDGKYYYATFSGRI